MTTSVSAYHEGEQAVQRLAGEGHEGWGSPMFGPEIPRGFVPFLQAQQMLIVGAPDGDGAVWCGILTGPTGFATALDELTVRIDAVPGPGDPLGPALHEERPFGVLAIEPHRRRRIRLNGRARREGARLLMRTEQVLGNCPKYIQARDLVVEAGQAPGEARWDTVLSPAQQDWIGAADTFFIASHSPRHGADASHRGGGAGFVTVLDERRLVWPDYFGNSFYMTLGNIELNPVCGLLFVDWERGDTLQLTGRGRIDWSGDRARPVPGALRLVEFEVDRVVQIPAASRLRWRYQSPSPVNPPVAPVPGA
jgi:predicted pyridoxine 5'-phosphate oxidase superfamily flavin-nucleotide-binding protein